jgi:hypothetical protein
MSTGATAISDRMQLEKELENLVDGMPTKAVEILVQYATKLKAVYGPQEPKQCQITMTKKNS